MKKYTLETYTQEKCEQDTKLIKAVETPFLTDFQNRYRYI